MSLEERMMFIILAISVIAIGLVGSECAASVDQALIPVDSFTINKEEQL